jgi:hypothetical protein
MTRKLDNYDKSQVCAMVEVVVELHEILTLSS